mgnify:CR=1 FL=1
MKLFVKKIIPLFVCFIIVIRLWVFLFYALFGLTKFAIDIVNDSFHHYFLGLGLLAIVLLFKNKLGKLFIYLSAFSIALVVDEYTLILKDIGFNLPYLYTSATDHISLVAFLIIALLISISL